MTIEVVPAETLLTLPAVGEVVPFRQRRTDGFQPGTVHRATAVKAAALMAEATRVHEPVGVGARKVKWEEFLHMREDPNFLSRAAYEQDMLRLPKSIRPVMAINEVGRLYWGPYKADDPRRGRDAEHWSIVYLADCDPGGVGEGKLHTVNVTLVDGKVVEDASDT